MKQLKPSHKNKLKGSVFTWRYVAAMTAVMLFVVAVVIFADVGINDGYSNDYINEAPYQLGAYGDGTSLIQVSVDSHGGIHITPYELEPHVYIEQDQYGNILLRLPEWIEPHDVDLALPYGWDYWVFGDNEELYCCDEYACGYCNSDSQLTYHQYGYDYASQYDEYTTPENFSSIHYDMYIGNTPYYYYPTAILITSIFGGQRGYMGIMPFAARMVVFDHNHNGQTDIRFTQTPDGRIAAAQMPPAPERGGHHFMGWTRTQDGLANPPYVTHNADAATGIQFTNTSTVSAIQAPVTVYAQWGHQVSFYGNGVALTPGNTTLAMHGPRVIVAGMSTLGANNTFFWTSPLWPNYLVLAGHRFMGWHTRSQTTGEWIQRFDGNTPITEDVLLIARWEPNATAPITEIIFDLNDGITDPAYFPRRVTTTSAGTIGAPTFPADPYRTGYRFLGWSRNQDGSGTNTGVIHGARVVYSSNFPPSDTPITVYAQWGHQVTFNVAPGGAGPALTPAQTTGVLAGQWGPRLAFHGLSVPDSNINFLAPPHRYQVWPNNPAWANHVFMGWWTMYNGDFITEITSGITIYEDIEIFARWAPTSRTIIFNMNDNGLTNPQDFHHHTITTGTAITAAVWNATPQIYSQAHPQTGQRRIAWTRTQDGIPAPGMVNTNDVNIGVHVHQTSNFGLSHTPHTVYAQWGYWVSFDLNGGTGTIGTDPNNGTHYVPRIVAAGRCFHESNIFIWTPNQQWPNHPAPPAGYVFVGWYTRELGVYQDRIGASTVITSDITLYARYEPVAGNPHTVFFDRNDGSGAPPVPVIPAVNASIPLVQWNAQVVPLQGGHPEGLVHMGWTRTQDGIAAYPWFNNGGIHVGVGVVPNGAHIAPMTAYAQWGYQVTFNGNGMTLANAGPGQHTLPTHYGPRRVIPGMSFAETNAIAGIGGTGGWLHQVWPYGPTRAGYQFIGWNTQSDGSGYMYNSLTPVNGNRILYAQWREAPFFVYFDLMGGYSPLPQSALRVAASVGAAARSVGVANWTTYVTPIAPYKPGHVFMAWTRTPEGYGADADTNMALAERFRDTSSFTLAQAPLTVFAQWGHTVTFTCLFVDRGSNHNNATQARTVSSGRSLSVSNTLTWTVGNNALAWPADPNRNAQFYRFMGWYTMDSYGNYVERIDAGTPITENLDLFTRWERRRVIFHPNDGIAAPPFEYVTINSLLETAPSAIGAARFPEDPGRIGYAFMGWTRTQDGSGFPAGSAALFGTRFTPTSQIPVAQGFPLYVYAQWGHSVTFLGNGALLDEGTNPNNPLHYAPRLVYPNHSVFTTNLNFSWISQVWPNNPSRFGHIFMGWYTRNAQGAYDQAFTAHTPITGNTVLYARWDAVTVIFDPQNGTAPQYFATRTVDADGRLRYIMPSDPIRTGYRFVAWTRTQSGYGNILPLSLLFTNETHVLASESPLTVFAQWGHQVSFSCNYTTLNIPSDANPNNATHYGPRIVLDGHSVQSSNSTFPWHNVVWPNNPTRNGYRFMGWYTADNQRFAADTIITQDVELYARWARRQVVFNRNDDGDTDPQDFVRVDVLDNNTIGAAGWPANPTRTGFGFLAWTRTPNGIPVAGMTNNNAAANGVQFVNSSIVPPAHVGDFYVYAQWSHSVTFNGNGFALPITNATNQNLANNYIPRTPRAGWSVVQTNNSYGWAFLVWPQNPPNANAAFVEWNTESDGTGTVFNGNTPIHENVTIFAIWETPEVIFHHNDGTSNSDTRNTHPGNGTVGVANMPVVDNPGYIFMGWSRTQNGDGAQLLGTTVIPHAEVSGQPLEVWAQWGNPVGFIIEGAPHTAITVINGRTAAQTHATPWASAPWPENPVSPGYTFMGWYTMSGGNYVTRYTANSVITQDTVLHARFGPEIPLVVNFRMNDGTPAIHATVTATQPGGSIGAGNMPANPSWGTRQFMGWTRSQAGTGVGMGNSAGELFTGTSTAITTAGVPYNVYAQWGYRVSFNGNGVNLTGADPNNPAHYAQRLVRTGMSFEASNNLAWTPAQVWPNNPVNPNNRFAGWWTRSGNDYAEEIFPDTVITGDIELFARWELRRVYFELNGGNQPLPGNHMRPTQANGQIGVPNMVAVPLRTDHRFLGWARNLQSPPFTATTYVPMADSPLTVHAQWGHQIQFMCLDGSGMNTFFRVTPTGISVAEASAYGWTTLSVGGASAGWPANPTRARHIFTHWQTPGGDIVDANTPINSELTLQAQWVLTDTVRVTFWYDDCDGAFLRTNHLRYRYAWRGHSVRNSTHHQHVPVAAQRLNQGVPWPMTAPHVYRNVPGEPRPMHVESWWTAPGGDQGGGEFFARHGASHGYTTNDILTPWGTRPAGWLDRAVHEDVTVYPTWVFRVNFHPNGGSLRNIGNYTIPGFWNMNPFGAYWHFTHVRDIPAVGPNYEGGTINEHGVLRNGAYTVVPMGMPAWDLVIPPMGMVFAGWWDVQFPNSPAGAVVPLGEEAAHGFGHATQYVGDEWIDRNIVLYARFVLEPPRDRIPITFVVNGGYWWANREGGAWVPLPYTDSHDDDIVLYSRYGHQLGHLHCDGMPILPLREGYVFMGWWLDQSGPPPGGLDTFGTAAWNQLPRFHGGIITYEPMTVYAHWEPAYLVTADPNHGWIMGTPHYAPGYPNARAYRLVARGRTFAQMQSIFRNDRNNTNNAFRSIELLPPPGRMDNHVGLPSGAYTTGVSWYISTANTTGTVSLNSLSLGRRLRHDQHPAINHINNPRTNFGLPNEPWNTRQDGTGAIFGQNTVVNSDMTIYAQWRSYVIFNANFDPAIHTRTVANVRRVIMEGDFSVSNSHLHLHWEGNRWRQLWPWQRAGAPLPGAADATIITFNNELHLYSLGTGLTLAGWHTHPEACNVSGRWFTEYEVVGRYPENTGNITVFAIWSSSNVFIHHSPGAGLYGGMSVPSFRRMAVPGMELGDVAAPPGDIDAGFIGMPEDNPAEWVNPVGVYFQGWNIMRNPADAGGMAIDHESISFPARTFHGSWSVTVIFHPTRGTFMVDAVTIDYNHPQDQYRRHPQGVRVPPGTFPPGRWPHSYARGTGGSAWSFNQWNTERWGVFEGTGQEFTEETPINRVWEVYAQWYARVTFDLQGGNINASTANVVRHVPEAPDYVTGAGGNQIPHGVTRLNDPHRRNRHSNTVTELDHPRTAENLARPVCNLGPGCCDPGDPCARLHSIMNMMPPPPQRPGYAFVGWEWYPNGTSNPPQPFTGDTSLPGNSRVYARWEIILRDFEFYKTDLLIYEDAPVVELRDGAVFHLYEEVSPGVWSTTPLAVSRSGGYVWDEAGDVWVQASQTPGLVDFTGQINPMYRINYIHRFKLVETVPPHGYILRTGYWIIDHIRSGPRVSNPLDHTTWILTITEHDESLPFVQWLHPSVVVGASGLISDFGSSGLVPAGDDEDDEEIIVIPRAWYVGNEPAVRFPFHKTDNMLYSIINNPAYGWSFANSTLLPDAQFMIYRWDSRTTSPPDGMAGNVRSGTMGQGQWVYFDSAESTGYAHLPMVLYLDRRYQHYQIVEVVPPDGFSMPTGQWRINIAYGAASPGTGWYYAQHNRWVRVGSISDLWMPDFIRKPETYDMYGAGEWYVSNMPVLELPLSGGMGRNMFIYSGMFMLLLAAGLMSYIAWRRRPAVGRHGTR